MPITSYHDCKRDRKPNLLALVRLRIKSNQIKFLLAANTDVQNNTDKTVQL